MTVGPLVSLWGFGPEIEADAVPVPEAVQETLARVGHDKIELRAQPPATRKRRGDMFIDLSALGEGYGADRLAAYLGAVGIDNYLAVTGTIRVRGRNAKGKPWGTAIEQPKVGGPRAVHSARHGWDHLHLRRFPQLLKRPHPDAGG